LGCGAVGRKDLPLPAGTTAAGLERFSLNENSNEGEKEASKKMFPVAELFLQAHLQRLQIWVPAIQEIGKLLVLLCL